MLNANQAQELLGATLYGNAEKIGKIGQVYLDDDSGVPEFATVSTGLFGSRESFVPLAQAQLSNGEVHVPYSKDQIRDAPNVDTEGAHLSQQEEAELYRYYGMDYTKRRSESGLPDAAGTRTAGQAVGRDVSGPSTDDAMTRSEQRLRVGTESVETGRARLRKYLVTENVTQTVPVTREEVRVEREPITDANRDAAISGPELSEEEHEVTLHAERPVVEKETVPVERVRLDTQTVTEQQQVNDEIAKEQIEVEGDTDERSPRR